ncbi:MAG TPA: formate dehydrogenase accessory protein FdhE [Polyangiaceae bacterium]|nr:formate dehydrogenase accessory protein FdhE [Polyangiaceae bacterium]
MRTIAEAEDVASAFERRAGRAELLAAAGGPASAPLAFARGLYRAQAALAAAVSDAHSARPLAGAPDADMDRVIDPARDVLRFVASVGPSSLAAQARTRLDDAPSLVARLAAFWSAPDRVFASPSRESPAPPAAPPHDYLSRAVLRPYVEVLARLGLRPLRAAADRACPFCAGPAWIASRRAAPDADGAERRLGCALCATEWVVRRSTCAACPEEDPAKLPSFRSERHPAVRVEACESCRRYVKSIDLTIDARAIPEVDDLLSVAMDLWAAEQGFMRLEPGLAGV